MSGPIRTQIGGSKAKLKELLLKAQQHPSDVNDFDDEELTSYITDGMVLHRKLLKSITKLHSLNKAWDRLLQTDPKEVSIKEKYIADHGDWTTLMKDSSDAVHKLQKQHKNAVQILRERDPNSNTLKTIPPVLEDNTPTLEEPQVINITIPLSHGSTQSTTTPLFNTIPPASPKTTPAPVPTGPPTVMQFLSPPASTEVHSSIIGLQSPFGYSPVKQKPVPTLLESLNQSIGTSPSQPAAHNSVTLSLDDYQTLLHTYRQSITQQSSNNFPASALTPPSIRTSLLPRRELPKFDGSRIQYKPFMDRFHALVGSSPDIPDREKLEFLQQSLVGDAAVFLSTIPPTDENYAYALHMLHLQFGGTLELQHTLQNKLIDLPSIKDSNDPQVLQSFFLNACSLVTQLQQSGLDANNAHVAVTLQRKLPEYVLTQIYESLTDFSAPLDTNGLLHKVHEIVRKNMRVKEMRGPTAPPPAPFGLQQQTTTMSAHAQPRPTPIHRKVPKQMKSCPLLCNHYENHKPSDCPVYRVPEDRYRRAMELKLCINCLRNNHWKKDCHVRSRCRRCQKPHHTSVCTSPPGSIPTSTIPTTTPFGPQSQPTVQRPLSRSVAPQRSAAPTQPSYRQGSIQRQNSSRNVDFPVQVRTINTPQQHRNFPQRHSTNTHMVNSNTGEMATSDDSCDQLPAFTHTCLQVPETDTQTSQETDTAMLTEEHPDPQPVIMLTKQVPVLNAKGQQVTARVFFDQGSNTSYIQERFAAQLLLPDTATINLTMETFPAQQTTRKATIKDVTFVKPNGQVTLPVVQIDRIATSVITATLSESDYDWIQKGEPLEVIRDPIEPDILIGNDVMTTLLGNTKTTRLDSGLTLHETDLGRMLSGRETTNPHDSPMPSTDSTYFHDYLLTQPVLTKREQPALFAAKCQEDIARLHTTLERFWKLETVGITEMEDSPDAIAAMKYFNDTVQRDSSGRYIARFPFSQSTAHLPSNRQLCYFRLLSTIQRLQKNPQLLEKYNDILEDQLKRDFIELVPNESVQDGFKTCYLPHHPVIKDSSTTSVRIVYDGSAKSYGTAQSINSIMHAGPSLLPQLPGILIRARRPAILISSDIEKAFLQIGLDIRDRDYTRFLWSLTGDPYDISCYRFKRVPFGLKSSPFLLNAVVSMHLRGIGSPTCIEILRNAYVDNVFFGVSTDEEGMAFYHESKGIFQQAAMNLREYVCNSPTLAAKMNALESCSERSTQQKILGIRWSTDTDTFTFTMPQPFTGLLTRRRILQHIASIFDPLGLLAPTVLIGKFFFQLQSEKSSSWDNPLSPSEQKLWTRLINKDWNPNIQITVPRRFFTTTRPESTTEMHVFCDASGKAYGAVAYLRQLHPNDHPPETSIIMAKSRLVPLQQTTTIKTTIPRLEMIALEVGMNLARFVLNEVDTPLTSITIYSDSACSLASLQNGTGSSVFIKNRIKKIRDIASTFIIPCTFRHIAGNNNPADVLSRGCTIEELRDDRLWWKGPQFLQQADLPTTDSFSLTPTPDSPRTMPPPLHSSDQTGTTLASKADITVPQREAVIDPSRFSSFHRLLRVFMTILRFLDMCKHDADHYISKAKRLVIMQAQLLNPPTDQTKTSLRLEERNNIWIFQGRIAGEPLFFLPKGTIAKLIVQFIHEKNHHSSPLFTLTKVRENFWIPKGRLFVQTVIKKCLDCKRLLSKPFHQKDFPIFPTCRTTRTRPFYCTGMDYAGPFTVLEDDNSTKKVNILLFTCLSTRYTHCELVSDQGTNTLLLALRRLSATYGTPASILCDNAAQFHLLSDILKECQHQMANLHYSSTTMPTLKFIPAASPWAGGNYERMVGLVKTSLKKAGTTKRLLHHDEFSTLIVEATSIINQRPITHVGTDEELQPIRPVDLVMPTKGNDDLLLSEPFDMDSLPIKQQEIFSTWTATSSLTNHFHVRWTREYPQALRERLQVQHRQNHLAHTHPPRVGDIVLIESSQPKEKWQIGKVLEVTQRAARVKNARTRQVIERPHKALYLLETHEQDEATSQRTKEKAVPKNQASSRDNSKDTPDPPAPTEKPRTHPMTLRSTSRTLQTLLLLVFISSTLANNTVSLDNERIGKIQDIRNHVEEIWQHFQYGILVVLLLAVCHLTYILLRMLWIIGSIIASVIRVVIRILPLRHIKNILCSCYRTIFRRNQRYSPRYQRLFIAVTMAIIVLGGALAKTCNDVSSFNTHDVNCERHTKETRCKVTTSIVFSARTDGSTVCLQLKNPANQKLIKEVTITLQSIKSTCLDETLYFSRHYRLDYESVHQCPWVGSCAGPLCYHVKPDQDIPELSTNSKRKPGYTRCATGCSCVSCGGCISCAPSCIFYRTFATAAGSQTYRLFKCPQWRSQIEVLINNDEVLLLTPGKKISTKNNFTIHVNAFSVPPANVHTHTFLQAAGQTAVTSALPSLGGGPIPGTLGDLQCKTESDAEDFRCKYNENACNCVPQGTRVHCSCKAVNIEHIFKKGILPQKSDNLLLETSGNTVTTKMYSQNIATVQLDIVNVSFVKIIEPWKCSVDSTQSSLTGCYSCHQGAAITLTCGPGGEGEWILATLQCDHLITTVNCSGSSQTLHLHASSSSVNWTCELDCGIPVKFTLLGELSFHSTFDENVIVDYSSAFLLLSSDKNPLQFIKDLVSNFIGSIMGWIYPIFLIGVSILIIFCFGQRLLGTICTLSAGVSRRMRHDK